MKPVCRLLRLTDGKLGAHLGKVYAYLVQIDVHLREGVIPGLDATWEHKIHELFVAGWEYLHAPVMTAALPLMLLSQSFAAAPFPLKRSSNCKHAYAYGKCIYSNVKCHSNVNVKCRHRIIQLLSSIPTYDLADFQEACLAGMHDLTDEVAFSERARAMASYKWANVYLTPWPHLQWAARRVYRRFPALRLAVSAHGP
mmetsp:Transcript_25487/g.77448  ORF Transcript_25487/g.77448 Transcript_25487/m.77448 type:complete len:198 (-) Transcript_25487:254-847(-)|eukprot:scaffold226662_cov29-Tisochrysis_lutea.AAC.3